jgi:magnesium chelatase family protein
MALLEPAFLEGVPMLASIPAASLLGVDGSPVRVEAHVSNGLPGFTVVGLPDTSCREAKERIRAALMSSGFAWPQQRVTINLAPSGIRKMGAGLDLPMAVALLVAMKELDTTMVEHRGFVGELGLDGSLRPVPGIVSLVDAIATPEVVVPAACAGEAVLVGRHRVHGVRSLADLVEFLRGDAPWPDPPEPVDDGPALPGPDLAEVRGQAVARFALEVAAAGGHHLLLVGPPGAGKTMLARRLVGLLPDLAQLDALEVTRVHSAAGLGAGVAGLMRRPPFRAPHHGASAVSLVGGGSAALRPGEISLAHRGVLFLDELGEFAPFVIDALRTPLEEGVIRVSRALTKATLPARFLLIAAMNPCPCGEGSVPGACRCSAAGRQRYARRLSGPLLDRFDLRVEVGRPEVAELLGAAKGESSAVVADRVKRVRALAGARGFATNAELPTSRLDELAPLSSEAARVVEGALTTRRLSARGLGRVRRVARTIADLAGAGPVLEPEHVSAALLLRTEPRVIAGAAA